MKQPMNKQNPTVKQGFPPRDDRPKPLEIRPTSLHPPKQNPPKPDNPQPQANTET